MSHNPYTAPDSTLEYGNLAMQNASMPALVKALAIISIVLGGFNIFGGICGIAGLGVAAAVSNSSQIQKQLESDNSRSSAEFRKAMDDVQQQMPMYIGQAIMSIIVSIGLIVGGIGTLKRKEWGRKWLVYSCVLYVLVTIATWIFTVMTTLKSMAEMDPAQKSGAMVGMVLGFAFGLIFLAFYAFVAFYFSKAQLRQHFQ